MKKNKKKKKNKDVEIKERVTRNMREEVESIAEQKGEDQGLLKPFTWA